MWACDWSSGWSRGRPHWAQESPWHLEFCWMKLPQLLLLLSVFTCGSSDTSSSKVQLQAHPHIPSPPSLILPTSSFGKEDPKIDQGLKNNVSASVGRTAQLKCRVKDLGHKSVSWVRHDKVALISVGKYLYIQDKRFRILHEPHEQDWILEIRSVLKEDQDTYECQVNTVPPLRRPVYLNVVDPFTEILGGKDVFMDQHSVINLTCVVHSPEQPAHIFWMHGKKPLHRQFSISSEERPIGSSDRVSVLQQYRRDLGQTVSTLVISRARPSDSGIYRCSPSNTKPAAINVHVLDGESTDALQTSGLSTLAASPSFNWVLTTCSVAALAVARRL